MAGFGPFLIVVILNRSFPKRGPAMWRWLLLIVLVVAISAVAAWISISMPLGTASSSVEFPAGEAAPDPTKPQPKLVIDAEPNYDFGVMSQQSKGRREWVITNQGEGPLSLTGTQPSCSCTVIDPKPDQTVTVEPGKSYTIKIEWETRQFSNKYRKEARVLTNDSARPTLDFIVTGVVEPPVVILPPEGVVNLQTVPNDRETKTAVMVLSPDRDNMTIVSALSTRPDFIEVVPRPMTPEEIAALPIKPKSAYQLDLRIKPTSKLGNFQEKVIVKTDHPLREEVQFTISGRVAGPVTVTPPTGVRMPEVVSSRGAQGSAVLTVRGHEHTTFTCPKAPPGIEVKVEPMEGDEAAKSATSATAAGPIHRYRAEVIVQPGTPPGVIDTPLILQTDHPGASEVELPVYIRILGQG
jgi:hypothetical protein